MADLDDLDSLDDFGDLEDISFDDPPARSTAPQQPATPQPAAPVGGLGVVIHDLLAKRNFQQVLLIAESQRQAIAASKDLQVMIEIAQKGLQQESYLMSYVEAAQQARSTGHSDQAEQYLAKAREIDPDHPALANLAVAQPAAPVAQPDLGSPDLGSPDFGPPDFGTPDFAASPSIDFGGGLDDELHVDALGELDTVSDAASGRLAGDGSGQAEFSATPVTSADFGTPLEPSFGDPNSAFDNLELDSPAPPFEAISDAGDAAPGFGDSFGESRVEPLVEPVDSTSEPLVEPLTDDAAEAPLTFDGGSDMPSMPGFDGAEDADSAEKIETLLQEGQDLYEQGQYQSSIDVWSRIFLVDIDHAEASRRIEAARAKKDELDRQAEEIFQTSLDHIEAEELDQAKGTLARVLELMPHHHTARSYLEQLEAGQVPVIKRAEPELPLDLLDDGGLGELAASVQSPGQSMEAAVARDRIVVVKKTDRRLVMVAAGVGLLLLAGIAFLALKWDDIFRNTGPEVAQAPPPAIDPITRATRLFENGNIESAILLLEKLPPEDPNYADAQALMTQWKAMVEAPEEEVPQGPSQQMIARRQLVLAAARDAHRQRRFIRARDYFERANKILPLETEDLSLKRDSELALQPIKSEMLGFDNEEYEEIIPNLWRMFNADEENHDVRRLLVDSYFNLALIDLQRKNPDAALEKLTDALEVDPENNELTRLKLFAESYVSTPPDLLYTIFVKYMPARS